MGAHNGYSGTAVTVVDHKKLIFHDRQSYIYLVLATNPSGWLTSPSNIMRLDLHSLGSPFPPRDLFQFFTLPNFFANAIMLG